ncbi:MAG: ergothioneine biosynthesis protein EgtB [Alphaproteobacteria bacterium]|nr:ergothioneine biosynthesis protein EgtB [Alphaproteobacteria bacterium]
MERSSTHAAAAARPDAALFAFAETRALSLKLAAPLSDADATAQSMPDASPAKWHLAHTTWFIEEFVLAPHAPGYRRFDPHFAYLFNSYYDAVGARHPRHQRGLLTRPSLRDVLAYRAHVDEAMQRAAESGALNEAALALITLGVHHEQQHQELLLTDLLHLFAHNPIAPSYAPGARASAGKAPPLDWIEVQGGVIEIGAAKDGFSFDCEGPRHAVIVAPFKLASRAATNREWRAFIEAGGYTTPALWTSDGFATAQQEQWTAPLYWRESPEGWRTMTLRGLQPVDWDAPVSHVSWYEADAFARWSGARLPSEQEWECAAPEDVSGRFLDMKALRPLPAQDDGLTQMYGDVWEWTASPYAPYPGFRAAAGAVGEYNGKFMINQCVLRGGSCATPPGHIRRSYRNFFYPHQRWQFAGVRLANDR